LRLDPGLCRVVDTAGQVAVCVGDGARREQPGQPHRENLRIAAMIALCRPYSGGPCAGSSWSARRWSLPCGTGTHSWSARAGRSGRATWVRRGRLVIARFRAGPDLLVVKRAVRSVGDGWWLEGDNPLVADDSR